MSKRFPRKPVAAAACALAALSFGASASAASDAFQPTIFDRFSDVASHLGAPPPDARPLMRWWWFGPAVAKPELQREILAMKAGGFGGFEIQPVYPMELDDPARGIRNTPYLSPDFLDAVGFANRTAHANGLRVDMTLASGWPYGGPHVTVEQAASRLRVASVDLPAGSTSFGLPSVMSGEKLIAAFVGEGSARHFDGSALRQIALHPGADRRASIEAAPNARVVVFYIASRTGQQVKRAAVGAEGFVLDHLDGAAVEHHLKTVAEPLMKAFGNQPPYSVFSDSLEVYSTDWTGDFLEQFRQRRGYDLTPYLPLLAGVPGDTAAAVRHDWAQTQTELVNERYLSQIEAWAKAHHTRFRSQSYGEPAVSLSSNRLVTLPEGEGPQFREFSFTRLATSAGHLYGRPVISAETWTWLHSPAFAATPLDMKAEADRMLLEGVNQFVGHGWPYTPPGTPEPGYSFYAAAVFNDHNPWWNVMPQVTSYLTRMSWLMRQGEPANQVAVMLPNDDVYAETAPGKVSLSAGMHKYVTPELTAQILDAGQNLDYVDAESILALGVRHPLLVLPHVTRLSPEVMARLAAYVRDGGKIIAVGSTPSMAPGLRDAERLSSQVAAASHALFAAGPGVRQVADDGAVGAAVSAMLAPEMKLTDDPSDVGFVRRKLKDADLYFIANTSNHPVHAGASFASNHRAAAWIDPDSGRVSPAALPAQLDLAPYESRVLVLSDDAHAGGDIAPSGALADLVDLSHDWTLSFPGTVAATQLPTLRSWTEDASTRYFSGVARYAKDVELSADQLRARRLVLDFGEGTPLSATPKVPAGMRAMLDSPVREAAQVYVNGKRAGAVWHPPYALDVTGLLHAGRNHIEVQVGNLGLNALAGHGLPDYRLLNARYGERFKPQDTELIAPQPSGMLGPVKLMGEKS